MIKKIHPQEKEYGSRYFEPNEINDTFDGPFGEIPKTFLKKFNINVRSLRYGSTWTANSKRGSVFCLIKE